MERNKCVQGGAKNPYRVTENVSSAFAGIPLHFAHVILHTIVLASGTLNMDEIK